MKPAKPCETSELQVSRFSLENPDETNETTPLKGWFRGFGFRATQRDGRIFHVDPNPVRSDWVSGWYAPWVILLLVVLAVTGVGVIQNARYGMWLDANFGSQTLTFVGVAIGSFGITFAILNLFKVMAPPAIIEAWRRGHRGVATVVAVAFVGLVALSVWNITAMQTIVRNANSAVIEVERAHLAALRDELVQTVARAHALGESRLPAVIERELEALRHDARWSSSEECRNATAKASRSFCADYARLFGELARANVAEQTRLKSERLRREVGARTTASAVGTTDPELAQISQMTGLDTAAVGWWRSVVLAVVFELVEAFGLTLAWLVRPVPHAPRCGDVSLRGGALSNSGEPPPRWLVHRPSDRPSAQFAPPMRQVEPAPAEPRAPSDAGAGPPRSKPALDACNPADGADYRAQIQPACQAAPRRAKQPAPDTILRPALRLVGQGVSKQPGQVQACPNAGVDSAIEAFVTHLGASRHGRATGGQLFTAYEAMRAGRGWPAMTQTAFGRQIRTAIERRGGRKIKSRGQQVYVGFVVPEQARVARGDNAALSWH